MTEPDDKKTPDPGQDQGAGQSAGAGQGQDAAGDERFFAATLGEAPDADPMGIEAKALDRVRGRRSRATFLVGAFVLLSAVLGFLLRGELSYFFSSRTPLDLGRAEDLQRLELLGNDFVRVEGIARDMCIRADLSGGRMHYLYLLGSEAGSRILVQLPVEREEGCLGAEERVFTGRVVDLAASGRFDAVLTYYREKFPSAPPGPPMFILLDGERPQDAWLYPAVFGLLLLMIGVNLFVLVRMRRAPAAPQKGEPV